MRKQDTEIGTEYAVSLSATPWHRRGWEPIRARLTSYEGGYTFETTHDEEVADATQWSMDATRTVPAGTAFWVGTGKDIESTWEHYAETERIRAEYDAEAKRHDAERAERVGRIAERLTAHGLTEDEDFHTYYGGSIDLTLDGIERLLDLLDGTERYVESITDPDGFPLTTDVED